MKSLSQRPFHYTCLSASVGRSFRSSCFPGKPSKLIFWDCSQIVSLLVTCPIFLFGFPACLLIWGHAIKQLLGPATSGQPQGWQNVPPPPLLWHRKPCCHWALRVMVPCCPSADTSMMPRGNGWELVLPPAQKHSFPGWVRIIFIKFIQSYPTSVSSSLSWACHIQ